MYMKSVKEQFPLAFKLIKEMLVANCSGRPNMDYTFPADALPSIQATERVMKVLGDKKVKEFIDDPYDPSWENPCYAKFLDEPAWEHLACSIEDVREEIVESLGEDGETVDQLLNDVFNGEYREAGHMFHM